MSDIDLKALRDDAEFLKSNVLSGCASGISWDQLLTVLDRLESAERRAEEAEKGRDAQKEISRGLVTHMQAITDAAGLPSDYVLSDMLISLDALRKDAARWNAIPAFTEDYQINYLAFERDIDEFVAQSSLRGAGVDPCDPDGMPRTLAQQVEILVAERDAFARDAARYRWICDGHGYFLEEQGLCHIDPDKASADAAIDERMAQEGGK